MTDLSLPVVQLVECPPPTPQTCYYCSIFVCFESNMQSTRLATIISDNSVYSFSKRLFSLQCDVHTTWETPPVENTQKRKQSGRVDRCRLHSISTGTKLVPARLFACSHSGAVLMLRKHSGADNRDQRTANTQRDLVCACVQFG